MDTGKRGAVLRLARSYYRDRFRSWMGGDAVATWEDFQSYARSLPEAAKADAFFFGYPSKGHSVAFCAAKFREFLTDLLAVPAATIINRSLPSDSPPRSADFMYQHVILCAHSMGAVVARRALVDVGAGEFESMLARVRLLFFAPAHKGSNLPLMLASAFGLRFPGSSLVANAMLLYYRSLDDLATGSATLQRLESDARSLREKREAKGATTDCLRARVLHSQNDYVVKQEPFDEDPPLVPVMGQNHRSICKPTNSYRQPVESLRASL